MLKKLEIKLPYLNTNLGNKDHKIKVLHYHSNEQFGLHKQSKKPTISNEIEFNSTKIKNKTQKLKEKILCDNKQNKYGRII